MFLLLEKLLPVLSKAFINSKCDPEFMRTSVSINVLMGEWNSSLTSLNRSIRWEDTHKAKKPAIAAGLFAILVTSALLGRINHGK